MYKTLMITGIALALSLNTAVMAKQNKDELPPGLQKKQARGHELPPGWQKKLAVGEVMDRDVYDHGRVVHRDGGLVTVSVEGKVVKVIENTREIVEILGNL